MPPVEPRPAASLVLLRPAPDGFEVLMGRRHAATRAFPDAMVFPGGKIEPGDLVAENGASVGALFAPAPPGAAHAALRETFEETGLWLADAAQAGRFPDRAAYGRLIPYAHWITPERSPYRFDTWFFLAVATQAEADAPLGGDEFESLAWAAPARAVADHATALLPPTRHSLTRLARHGSVEAALAEARTSGLFDAGGLRAGWESGGR